MTMLNNFDIGFLREREDHAATQGFLGGIVLGTLFGIVLALIFAPRRGEETRAAVASKAAHVTHKTANFVSKSAPFASHEKDPETLAGEGAAIEREIGGSGVVDNPRMG